VEVTPYRTNVRPIESPRGRRDAWIQVLRFLGAVALEILAMGF
jgi:hypothetical protein